MNKYINIAFGADDNYAMSLAVAIYSSIINADKNYIVNVYIIHDRISSYNENKLRDVVRIASPRATLTLLRLDQDGLDQLSTPDHFTVAAYFRILLPDAMPARESKVIYLDSDLLVRGDLSILWRMDMKGMPLMAVRDYAVPFISSRASELSHLVPRLHPETPFLNSGVMVMDLDAWRSELMSKKMIKYAYENNSLDQVAINAVISGRCLELDPLWNVQVYINTDHHLKYIESCNYTDELMKKRGFLMKEALVYHFSGGRKPWAPGCALPGQVAWLDALRRSGWHKNYIFYLMYTIISLDIILRYAFRSIKSIYRRLGHRVRASIGVTV